MAKLAAITCRYDTDILLAPLPNALFSHCGSDELSSYESSAPIDLGRFITALFVVHWIFPANSVGALPCNRLEGPCNVNHWWRVRRQ